MSAEGVCIGRSIVGLYAASIAEELAGKTTDLLVKLRAVIRAVLVANTFGVVEPVSSDTELCARVMIELLATTFISVVTGIGDVLDIDS